MAVGARNGDSLLLAAGEFLDQVVSAIFQPHLGQGFTLGGELVVAVGKA